MKNQKIIYYKDELNDDFEKNNINEKKIDGKYKYIHGNIIWKVTSSILYRVLATPIAYIYSKIKFKVKFENKDILKKYKKSGYFLYINHTQPIQDVITPSFVSFPKRAYIIANPKNISIPIIGKIIEKLGAIPLPQDNTSTINFLNCIKQRIKEKSIIAIYPEAHIWPYYTKIRPYIKNSFRYPIKLKVPSFSVTITYHKKLNSKKIQIVAYIDGPFYADEKLGFKDKQEELRNKIYKCMLKRSENNNIEYIKYEKIEE